MVKQAQAKDLESPTLRTRMYLLAFLQNDTEGMAQQVAWSRGKRGVENVLLAYEADTSAYFGRLGNARELSRRAVAVSRAIRREETAATYETAAALREALLGNASEARQRAAAALGLSTDRDVQYGAALALSLAGDTSRSQELADDLGRRFPEDTIAQVNFLPTLSAQLGSVVVGQRNHLGQVRRKRSKSFRVPRLTSWVHSVSRIALCAAIQSICAGKPIWPDVGATKPPPSSRKSSTILALC